MNVAQFAGAVAALGPAVNEAEFMEYNIIIAGAIFLIGIVPAP